MILNTLKLLSKIDKLVLRFKRDALNKTMFTLLYLLYFTRLGTGTLASVCNCGGVTSFILFFFSYLF